MARVGRRGTGNYGEGMEVSSVNSVSKRSWGSSPRLDLLERELPRAPLSEWSGSGGQSRAVWLLGSPSLVEGLRRPVLRVSPAGAIAVPPVARRRGAGRVGVPVAVIARRKRDVPAVGSKVRRFRERCRQRGQKAASEPREGHHKAAEGGISCCARPGGYVLFRRTRRSPCQQCCGPLCRRALRCVRVREARWRRWWRVRRSRCRSALSPAAQIGVRGIHGSRPRGLEHRPARCPGPSTGS